MSKNMYTKQEEKTMMEAEKILEKYANIAVSAEDQSLLNLADRAVDDWRKSKQKAGGE